MTPGHVTITHQDALDRIDGSVVNDSVVYYDDAMRRYYVGHKSDLDDLVRLMGSDDEDIARDAYSHWCAGSCHGEGYETEEEAIIAAANA